LKEVANDFSDDLGFPQVKMVRALDNFQTGVRIPAKKKFF
jgi:hypothetical protein